MNFTTFRCPGKWSGAKLIIVLFLSTCWTFLAAQTADLSIQITSNSPTFAQWTNVTYTITLHNSGPSAASNVGVHFAIPGGMAYTSHSTSAGTYSLFSQVWTVGTVASGASPTLSITLFTLVNTPIIAFTQVDSASPSDPDSTPGNNEGVTPTEDDEAAVTINPGNPGGGGGGGGTTGPDSIDLQVTNTISQTEFNYNQIASFIVVVTNNGPGKATGVKLKDLLPPGLQYDSHNAVIGTYNPTTGIWSIGEIPTGSDRTLVLNAKIVQGGTFTNAAQITAATEPDKDSSPNNMVNNTPAEDDEAAATITGLLVDLELHMTGPLAPVALNTNVTFNLTLNNVGPTIGHNCKVRAILPVGLQFVSSNASIGTYDTGTGVWLLTTTPDANGNKPGFDMPAGASKTLQLVAKVIQAGPIDFVVEVRVCNQPDVDSTPSNFVAGEDDQDQVTVTTTGGGGGGTNADLALTQSVTPTIVSNGSTATFTLTLSNTGAVSATGVTVKDVIPAGLTVTGTTASIGSFSGSTWTVGSLGNGASATLTITTTVGTITAPISNFAQVQTCTQTDSDSSPGNNTTNVPAEDDEALATISPNGGGGGTGTIDLETTFTSSNQNLPIYQNITFTVSVINKGPGAASNVTLKYVLPQGMAFVSKTQSKGNYDSWTGTWDIGALAANETATLTVTLFILQTTPLTQFVQIMTASPTDIDSSPGNNNGTVPAEDDEAALTLPNTGGGGGGTTPPKKIDLALTKTVSPAQASVGTQVVFTLTLNNTGDTTASSVTVKDLLPAGLSYVSSSTASGSYSNTTGIWTVGTVANASTKTLTITCNVTAITGSISNFAQVQTATGPGDDSTPGNNTTSLPVEDDEALAKLFQTGSANGPDLQLTMSGSSSTYQIYNNVTFTLTILNNGNQTASNITVDFPLPTGVAFVGKTQTIGTYDAWTHKWTIPSLAAAQSGSMTLTIFTLSASSPLTAYAQVTAQSPNDSDSTPNNNAGPTPVEDDEAAATLSPAALRGNGPSGLSQEGYAQQNPVIVQKIYPNPTDSWMFIDLSSNSAETTRFDLFDGMGRRVMYREENLVEGDNTVSLDISQLQSGLYYLLVSTGNVKGAPVKILKE